ncbi:MAG: valine--tRNA ligase [Chlamydiales bacterium]
MLPKAYDPKETDAKWGDFWESNHFFEANPASSKPPFSMVMPPPNVTGVLHMGHALVSTLQDILARWMRMRGYETLWVPGTDHAGIATQTVVERHLMATEKKRRSEYSREEFLAHIWVWKEEREKTILSQLRKIGCSCDWSRLRFTMDEGCNFAVRSLFKRLFDKGLIYRGDYLVNWDPVTETALADDEVEYEERDGFLWYFRYHLANDSGYVEIATTRPETMLGDTAIAVSPRDERYAHLVGQKVRLPLIEREIPIIADRHVDPDFGTGMVKVTPAHDPNDYRMGLDYNLPMINILTPDGRINENGGPFQGMSREEARQKIVAAMESRGLLMKRQRYIHRVGVSYRSKAVIEPYLSKQWFLKMEPFKKKLQETEVKILPSSWKQTYLHWIDNLRDWCISRQLWWGHRIPIWYNRENPDEMICHGEEGVPKEVAADPDSWIQEKDVLDTWFSSALWPFSTLGWPAKTPLLEKFYPNSVLVTGHDILFFWVARMILMGEEATGEVPFPETFLHGLIYGKSYWKESAEGGITYVTGQERRDYDMGKPIPKGVHSKWEKLSKSKGNVIDPLEMIEEYGTDAVRMSLCASANQSPQIDLDRRRFEEFKNFANKMWNGARFVFMNLEGLTSEEFCKGINFHILTLEDRWILSALNRLNTNVNACLTNYNFESAAHLSYNFFWKEFCAYYVEIAKPVLAGKEGNEFLKSNKQKILIVVLCNMLRLMHPMCPFITEELFQHLKQTFPNLEGGKDPYTKVTVEALRAKACVVAPYPELIRADDLDEKIEEQFAIAEELVYTIRNIRGEMKIPSQLATDVYLVGAQEEHAVIIRAMIKSEKVELVDKLPSFNFAATGVVGGITLSIPLPDSLALKERERLAKEQEKTTATIESLKNLLTNADFLDKAHPDLIAKKRATLSQLEQELATLEQKLRR